MDGEPVFAQGGYIGFGKGMSNNVAEYSGCIEVLSQIASLDGVAVIRGDSKLVIMQLFGKNGTKWKVHGGCYVPYYQKAKAALEPLRQRVSMLWVPREQNGECDEFSKQVLRDRGVQFRIQPEG